MRQSTDPRYEEVQKSATDRSSSDRRAILKASSIGFLRRCLVATEASRPRCSGSVLEVQSSSAHQMGFRYSLGSHDILLSLISDRRREVAPV